MRSALPSIIVTAILLSCALPFAAGQQSAVRLESLDPAATQWRSYANDVRGTNYSPLAQIDSRNFPTLEIAWQWIPEDEYSPFSQFQVPPLMADGALYFSTPLWQGVAIDAATGETVWVNSPTNSRNELSDAPQSWSPTGVAYWTDEERDARVFWGTGNGYLICADAHTGQRCAGFGTEETGRIDTVADLTLGSVSDRRLPLSGALAPIVVDDSVIYGRLPGALGAWHARTGTQRWAVHTPPRDVVEEAETWSSDVATAAAGMNSALVLAADNEFVYFPDWANVSGRPSQALVALHANTGERIWRHEATDAGSLSYGFSRPNVLNVGTGESLVTQIDSNGLVHVFQRATGEEVRQLPPVAPLGDQRVSWASAVDPETGRLYAGTTATAGFWPPAYAMGAFNLTTGERLWEVTGVDDTVNAFAALDAPPPTTGGCPGGPLLTKTLVIQCRGGFLISDPPRLVAYSKSDGRIVGSLDLPGRAIASPLTYMVGDVQYIAVAIQGNRLVGYAPESATAPMGVALTGWDRDRDGLRDDVQTALAQLYEDSEVRAVMQGGARAYQMAVLSSATNEEDDDVAAAEAISRFIWCLNEYPSVDSSRELATVQFLVFDTDARDSAYEKFEAGRQGSLPRVVPATRAECIR